MQIIDSVRSLVAAMQASADVGRGFRFRDQGDKSKALVQARLGLTRLSKRYVRRSNPVEGSALVSLSILAEDMGVELGQAGASEADLVDSISYLQGINPKDGVELCASIPFLQARLATLRLRNRTSSS